MTRHLAPRVAAGKQKQRIVARTAARAAGPAATPETGPRRAPTGSVLALQRSIGNRAVTRLVQGTPTGGSAPLLIQRNPAKNLINAHTAVGVLNTGNLAKALLERAAQGEHAFVHEVLDALEPRDREAVAVTMTLSVGGAVEKSLNKSEEGRRLLARLMNGESESPVRSPQEKTAPQPSAWSAPRGGAAPPPQSTSAVAPRSGAWGAPRGGAAPPPQSTAAVAPRLHRKALPQSHRAAAHGAHPAVVQRLRHKAL